jgi:hypothetical protein
VTLDREDSGEGGNGRRGGSRRALLEGSFGGGRASQTASFLRAPWFLGVVLPVLALFLIVKLVLISCFTYVGPNQFGIKVVRVRILDGPRGVHSQVYDTGFHLILPLGLEEMYLFPRDVQVLDLTGAREEAAREARVSKPAHIQTSDGFFVDVDVSILYRILDSLRGLHPPWAGSPVRGEWDRPQGRTDLEAGARRAHHRGLLQQPTSLAEVPDLQGVAE